eukprot:g30093.t1
MPVLAPPDSQNYASLASTQLLPRPSQEHPWTEKLQPSVYYDATNAALDSHVNVQSWMATPEARDAAMEVE